LLSLHLKVRKKKKASRVGFGRDDEVDDPDTSAPSQDVATLPAQLPPQTVPPPPVTQAPAITPELDEESDYAENHEQSNVASSISSVPAATQHNFPFPAPVSSGVANAVAMPSSQSQPAKRSSLFGWFGGRSDAPAPGPTPTSASAPASASAPVAAPAVPIQSSAPASQVQNYPVHNAPMSRSELPLPETTSDPRRPSVTEVPFPPPSYAPEPPVTPVIAKKEVPLSPQPSRAAVQEPVSRTPSAAVTKPAPSAPSKPEDPISALFNENQILGSEFSRTINRACESFNESMARLKILRAKLTCNKSDIAAGKLRLSEMELEQQRLAQVEAFEEADELNHRMEGLRRELESKGSDIDFIRSEESELLKSLGSYREVVCSTVEDFTNRLVQLRSVQELEAEKLRTTSERELSVVEERLQAEEERVTTEMRHLRREEEVVIEESSTIEAAISSQSGKLLDEKSELDVRLMGLDSEIQQLELQLSQKRAEARQVRESLEEVEDRIGDVRKKYDRQLVRIADRRNALNKALSECIKEETSFNAQRDLYEDHKRQLQLTLRRVRNWCLVVDAESSNADIVKAVVSSSPLDEILFAATPTGTDSGNQLVEAVVGAEVALAGLTQTKSSIIHKQQQLVAEAGLIDSRVPVLENEKKEHAVSKRYKEAAQVAKDIKALSVRKDEIETELAAASETSLTLEKDLEQCSERLRQASLALKQHRAEEVTRQYRIYVARIAQLKKAVNNISGSVTAITASPAPDEADSQEIRDSCAQFEVALVSVINNELAELMTVAAVMKSEYSLSDDLADETSEHLIVGDDGALLSSADSEDRSPAKLSDEAVDQKEENGHASTDLSREFGEEVGASPDVAASQSTEPQPEEKSEDELSFERQRLFEKVRALVQQRDELTHQRDSSAEAEDYDAAAEFDEQLAVVSSELDDLLELLMVPLEEILL
jgi:hypothetical protein